MLLASRWGAQRKRREQHWALEGCQLTFLPSLKTRWGLRDKKEQLSNAGLLRTREGAAW